MGLLTVRVLRSAESKAEDIAETAANQRLAGELTLHGDGTQVSWRWRVPTPAMAMVVAEALRNQLGRHELLDLTTTDA